MSKGMRGSPKSRRRRAPVMICRSGEMQTGMISLAGPIGNPSPRPSWQTVKLQAKIRGRSPLRVKFQRLAR
jgi:hypothetical protein